MQEEGEDEAVCERCMRGGREAPGSSDTGPTYEVRECPELGRYLVAARDLVPGEVVFRAAPIVSGLQPGSVPLCLGCYRPLQDAEFRCPTCGWPLCSEDCVLSLRHQVSCDTDIVRCLTLRLSLLHCNCERKIHFLHML